ncbi:hypothetical protein QEN19_002353 [Hanseniaspora menglaensis]
MNTSSLNTPTHHFLSHEDKNRGSTPSLHSTSTVTCKHCELPITSGHAYELGEDSRWHIDCFQCYKCDKKLNSDSDFLVLSTGALVCYECSDTCTICSCKIDELAIILSNSDEAYCRNCFKCSRCDEKISNLRYAKTKRGLYCIKCHERLIEKRKQASTQQQRIKSSSSFRNVSVSESPSSSDISSNMNSSTTDVSDFAKKAREKAKRLPMIPSPELKKRKEFNESEESLPSARNLSSDEFNNFKQPPDLRSKSRIIASDSSLNLSAHTTAENSPLIPQQGTFALRSHENLTKKHYFDQPAGNENNTLLANTEHHNNGLDAPMRSPKRSGYDAGKGNNPNDINLEELSYTSSIDGLDFESKMLQSKKEITPEQYPVSTNKPQQRIQPLYHSRNLSEQNDNIKNSLMKSPTVLGNMSVKSTPTIAQNGFTNNNTSKNQQSNKKTASHSRKPSIDDVLASTLKSNVNSPENDLFLNKTPLQNNLLEEENEIGAALFHNSTTDFIDNQSFLDDESIQMALKMRNEISPAKAGTIVSSAEEFMTASNSRNDINKVYNESFHSGQSDRTNGTPKKLGRSLSLKSPKKFFQNLTKSPNSGNLQKRDDSFDSEHAAASVLSDDFSVYPLPTELLTTKQQQKIDSQTGYSTRHRKTSSNSSITNKMYSSNSTMPLSEQTLMDGQQVKMKLNQMFKSAGVSYSNGNDSKRIPSTNSNHQRSTSTNSAVQRSKHSRTASLDYMNGSNQKLLSNTSIQTGNSDFESNFSESFKFGSASSNNNNELTETMLQLRTLKLDIYNLENTKKALTNDVENLSHQKNKILIELSELKAVKNNSTNALNNQSLNHSQTVFNDEIKVKDSNTSINTSYSSLGISDSYTNEINNSASANSKPRFWKSIFQSNDKSNTVKPIDKTSIRISASTSQPLLTTLAGSASQNNISTLRNKQNNQNEQKAESNILISELIKIENKFNDISQINVDDFSHLTAITNDGKTVRDYSLIGYCKLEHHSGIPFFIRFFIDFMENNSTFMKQEGIYRKAASKTIIEQFEFVLYENYHLFIKSGSTLNYGKFYEMCSTIVTSYGNGMFYDAHLLCSCFKRFLRRLLVPVFPYTNYFDLINDNNAKVILPKEHEQTIQLIVNHLKHVTNQEQENKMSVYNLSLVFAPSLLRDLNNEREMLDFKERVKYIESLFM